jgi:hypothetical protein
MEHKELSRLSSAQETLFTGAVKAASREATGRSDSRYLFSRDPNQTIQVLRMDGFPRAGMHAAVSSGLMHYAWTDSGFPDRLELLHVWDGATMDNEKLVVVAAESMVLDGRPAKPGAIYLDAVKAARVPAGDRMPHALLTFPYMGSPELDRVAVGGTSIWVLQVTPIFEQERRFIEKNGFAKFEELLSYDAMDLHEMNRGSHVR